ncbi:MAG: Ig-like domain-containing protein [Thermodesulfobacteriota bacterium]
MTPATLSSIAVTPANPSVPAGVNQQFIALGTYSDGTSHDITTQVTWTSSNTSEATVSNSGLATAITVGTATITATSGSISGSTTLTVTPATLSSIAVTPNPFPLEFSSFPTLLSIPVGATLQFTALGTYSDGTSHDITTQVTWTSSNPAAATISSSGLATAFAAGTANITATFETISGSTTLTVTSATLSFITVIPSIPVGVTQQFVAIGTNPDGSTRDITQQVTWTSSNTSVTTVNSSGQATAIAAGAAVLIATTESNFFPSLPVNISGTTTLRVTP